MIRRDESLPETDLDDADGSTALYYGACYYDEGMSYTDSSEHDKRVAYFRAAEALYRRAADRGNAVAFLNLGYVYSYDRCEGHYWRDSTTLEGGEDHGRLYPREKRAFECFKIAAETGICEACYKLGDMYKYGTGCEPNAVAAFRWYLRASQIAVQETPAILGSIALRLASCHEEGFGCAQDFGRALEWYRCAVVGLDAAVDTGDTWYEKSLAGARAGVKRCDQEVRG